MRLDQCNLIQEDAKSLNPNSGGEARAALTLSSLNNVTSWIQVHYHTHYTLYHTHYYYTLLLQRR